MNLQPISPPSQHTLKGGCSSCGGDVRFDSGFADLDAKPGTYLCVRCVRVALGSVKAAKMIDEEQIKQLKLRGVLSSNYNVKD